MKKCTILLFGLLCFTSTIHSQIMFERDINFNTWLPFHSSFNSFGGAAWGDLNNDGYSDIIVGPNAVFFNNGDGTFTRDLNTTIGAGFFVFTSNVAGVTMADIDNDDDLDVFINCSRPFAAALNKDVMYINDGNGVFTADTLGPWNPVQLSWGASFGDYNNDGYVDLVAAHPAGFIGTPRPSNLFINQDGSTANFENDTTYGFTRTLAPYTVPYWSDYDLDGDQDLFIASGPGGTPGLDSVYVNQLSETQTATLKHNSVLPFATDLQDGQCYNFIDYDNDGDKDLFLTNWSGAQNNFYVQENGQYTNTAMPFTYNNSSLTNAWGDVNNDGYIDVIISNHNSGLTELWLNDGSTFTLAGDEFCNQFGNSGVFLADINNDGGLDFYATGANRAAAIYINQNTSGNHFIGMTMKGNPSNRAAIGTQIRVVATINGNVVNQLREVSAQNAFQGHNDLRQHLGLGDATMADSVIVYWPSGNMEFYTNVLADSFYTITEGEGMTYSSTDEILPHQLAKRITLFPNPTDDSMTIELNEQLEIAEMNIYDQQGKLVKNIPWEASSLTREVLMTDVPVGTYFLHVKTADNKMFAKKFVKM